jgi:nicotinamide-nucleotide amidase
VRYADRSRHYTGSGDKILTMNELENLAQELGTQLLARGEYLAAAESCTGGWLAQSVTAIAGSSGWFDRGFVTYSNAAKVEMLGVAETTLERHGAVSEATARAMAQGALSHSRAGWSVAITGVAGPSGGSPEKPVGTVCFAWASKEGGCEAQTCHFSGDRAEVREQSVRHALRGLIVRVGVQTLSA